MVRYRLPRQVPAAHYWTRLVSRSCANFFFCANFVALACCLLGCGAAGHYAAPDENNGSKQQDSRFFACTDFPPAEIKRLVRNQTFSRGSILLTVYFSLFFLRYDLTDGMKAKSEHPCSRAAVTVPPRLKKKLRATNGRRPEAARPQLHNRPATQGSRLQGLCRSWCTSRNKST